MNGYVRLGDYGHFDQSASVFTRMNDYFERMSLAAGHRSMSEMLTSYWFNIEVLARC